MQVPGDLPRAHAPCVQRYNLVIKARKAALILGDQLRIEAARTVTRHLDLDLASVRYNGLATLAMTAVANLLIATKMIIHLGIERSLGKRLLERVQQSALIQCRGSIRARQKLIQ